jgi:hypothetical protein
MALSGGSAVGNSVYQTSATAGSGTFTIQMTASQECVIHNLMWAGACTITITDGTNAVVFFTASTAGYLANIQIHIVATSYYLIMTDTSGSTNNMSVNGIRTV